MKKICLVLCGVLLTVKVSFAITLLMEQEAVKEVFRGEAAVVASEVIKLTFQQVSAVKKALGGNLVHVLNGLEAKRLNNLTEFKAYFAKKDDKLMSVALIIEEPGKWGSIKFIVKVNSDIVVEKVLVMNYTESRGRPIASNSFLSQFVGKTLKNQIKLNKDIQGISGATISSEAASFAVKKALVISSLIL